MNNILLAIDVSVLEDKTLFDDMYARQRTERRDKIDKMKIDTGKRLSLGAGIVMEEAFARAGCADARISYGAEGKPLISDQTGDDIYFNLTHTESIAVCALSDREVGVDIEGSRNFDRPLIEYIFSESEIELIDGELFKPHELWTVKESVMKWTGQGIGLSPKSIEVYPRQYSVGVRISDEKYADQADNLRFSMYHHRDYAITVCTEYELFTEEVAWLRGLI